MPRWIAMAKEEHKLEMTPLIDVTFLLLVFFLCTLRFRTLEGRLAATLPRDAGLAATPVEHRETLEVRTVVRDPGRRVAVGTGRPWDGGAARFELAGRSLEYRVGPRRLATRAALDARLRQLHVDGRRIQE